jgi:hypothetical protein
MKTLFREYAIIGIVIVAGMAAYVAYHYNRQDILEYGLDVIGERLVEMVDSEESKQAIRERFSEFRQSVLDRQVPADRVETLAANVLNMSNAGTSLSREEADMVLGFAVEPSSLPLPALAASESLPDAPDSLAGTEKGAGPPQAVTRAAPRTAEPPGRGDLERLADRLSRAIDLDAQVRRLMSEMPEMQPDIASRVMFHADGGLTVSVDTGLVAAVHVPGLARLTRSLGALDEREMLIWKRDLAHQRSLERTRATEELDRIVEWREGRHEALHDAAGEALRALEEMKMLEMKGYMVSGMSDSLEAAVLAEIAQIEGQVEVHISEVDQGETSGARVHVRVRADTTR